ncbi:MAG TPA: serine hydrolase [Pyrinomonadaceae bacterium]|jgi:beta-lactamase class A
MKNIFAVCLSLVIVCFLAASIDGQKKRAAKTNVADISKPKVYEPIALESSSALQTLLNAAVGETVNAYAAKNMKFDYVAATLIDLRDPKNLKTASVRGDEKIYPASVVKLFYMVALEQQLADGKVRLTPELERGLKDMIVDSSNEATQYILDVLTDTSSGGELLPKEYEIWSYKRNAVNRYFTSLGYDRINVNQKTFCEDAYGREQQFRNYKGENRNMLNTNATARLLAEIVLGKAVNAERSKMMMDLLKRDPFAETKGTDDQAHDFTGIALINKKLTGARLWSKAGWTSSTRHDAAYVETPDGLKFVLVVFTEKMANERDIIPTIAGKILDGLKTIK